MPRPATFTEQLLRRKPVVLQAVATEGEELGRNLTTFQLMMFGVGATVGTGGFSSFVSLDPQRQRGVVILSGMCLMAWNMWRTYRAAPAIEPQPLLPVDASEVRA